MEEKPAGSKTPDRQNGDSPSSDQQSIPLAAPVEVNDQTWERSVEKTKTLVAVMFYSPTCAFCHQMDPYFRSYAVEYRDRVLFVRLNIVSSQWTAERYGIRSTPTFKFFCDGKPVQELVGAIYPALLKKMIEDVLLHGKECAKNSTLIDYEITGYG
nr:thioredoxin family protein [uncultured Methanoregula sp.]